jgi:hypothetical protein
MQKELVELRSKRLEYVESIRVNNFEEGIKRLLTDLYPDNAHFIYELLQNAEDPRATTVRFTLTHESIEFEHDGDRLFDLKDVDSITSIGASTKRDDPTSIGKFGVGFKAVFAYTQTPEIHSGEFRFRIRDLVVPETEGVAGLALGKRETRFIFPFDHPTKKPEQALLEIERALRALGDNTLLFLRHIRKIEYLLPDGSLGSLERFDHEDGRTEIQSSHPGGDTTTSNWLRFDKDVQATDEDGSNKSCGVAIAYLLEVVESKKKKSNEWEIVSVDPGQVSIYFPAEKETSNLKFHIHAPFASTVARDSVRDCAANDQLRDGISDLVVESLSAIRERGWLSMRFLTVLPNPADNLPDFYKPLQQKVIEAFQEQDLTPTRNGHYRPSEALFRGPARIVEVLSDQDMLAINDWEYETPLWAANPAQQNQREDRFLSSLEIDPWSWEELKDALENCAWDEDMTIAFQDWISAKDDAWLMRFYALLWYACDEEEYVDVSELNVVRVTAIDGERKEVLPKDVYFMPEDESLAPEGIFFVKPEVYSIGRSEKNKKSAYSFLEEAGVRSFDEEASIQIVLEEYDKAPVKYKKKDIQRFVSFWKKHPDKTGLFRRKKFLIGVSSTGKQDWYSSGELCLDQPYVETGLAQFTEVHTRHPLWEGYAEKMTDRLSSDFKDFLVAIGIMTELRIQEFGAGGNPHANVLRQDYYKPGVRWTSTSVDEDFSINGIEGYLATSSIAASRLIWSALIKADQKAAKARFRPNRQYPTREAESRLINHLKNTAWVPNKNGEFCLPKEMSKDDLSKELPYDERNGLLLAIGFGEEAKQRSEEFKTKNAAAKGLGFDSADDALEFAQLAKDTGMTPAELRTIASRETKASQPEDAVGNPTRRRKGVLERRENTPAKASVKRERTIQPGARDETLEARAYLRAKYTNLDHELVCQCCRNVMPFQVKGEYYFEAIQCVRGLDRHFFENRLALCPVCAAMYQHAKDTDDEVIQIAIVELTAPEEVSFVEIPVKLAGKEHQLRFVGTHWFDLKTVIED